MLTVTTAPDLSSQVRESLWEAGQEDKSSTLAGTSKEGVLRQQVGGTVWQTAVGVGGVCTGCCCRNLCKCRAALLLLLRLFGTQVSSSSEQVRRWVGSPEPGHSAKHRPKWRLLHLHLQLGSLRERTKIVDIYFFNLPKIIFILFCFNFHTCRCWPMTICPPPASTTAKRE